MTRPLLESAAEENARRLSVIIPTLNEEQRIAATLERVLTGQVWEVIVADGRSDDRTCSIAQDYGAIVIDSPPGRGHQLRVGCELATGDTLLFLHADTLLPKGFASQVFQILGNPGVSAGAFRLIIDAPGRWLRVVEWLVNLRGTWGQMPYGDQAVFVRASILKECAGFPDLPVMEDYALVRRLRRMGRIGIAPTSVVTSGRRWQNGGVFRTSLGNQLCITAFRVGVNPDRIARWRSMSSPGSPAANLPEQPPGVIEAEPS